MRANLQCETRKSLEVPNSHGKHNKLIFIKETIPWATKDSSRCHVTYRQSDNGLPSNLAAVYETRTRKNVGLLTIRMSLRRFDSSRCCQSTPSTNVRAIKNDTGSHWDTAWRGHILHTGKRGPEWHLSSISKDRRHNCKQGVMLAPWRPEIRRVMRLP